MSQTTKIRRSKPRKSKRASGSFAKKLFWAVFYSLPLLVFLLRGAEPASGIGQNPVQMPYVPAKVIIHKSRPKFETSSGFGSLPLPYSAGRKLSPKEVRAYVQAQALERGVDPDLAIWIVKHESEFNPRAKGDGEASRGLWQISKIYHPEVSDDVAFSMTSSTHWSLGRIAAGKANEWSTYRFCRTLYKDCPY